MLFLKDPAIWIKEVFISSGLNDSLASYLSMFTLVIVIGLLSWLSFLIAKTVILRVLPRIVKTTSSRGEILLERKVFSELSYLAPAFVIWLMAGWALNAYPVWLILVNKLTFIYIIIIGTLVLSSFIDAWYNVYKTLPISQSRHIKGYVQLIKIFMFIIALLMVVSIVFRKDLSTVVAGLGAVTAVIIIVFKDILLGLVASIQLSADNLLKVGDWITMPGRNVDGIVTDITINTVKIQNFDKTIITVPAHLIINESFQNWRGMEDSGVRQIKRIIYIDIKSIRFLTGELRERLCKVLILKEFIESFDKQNGKNDSDRAGNTFFNSSQVTNLGVFRFYAETYLKKLSYIDTSQTVILRHREMDGNGLPLQVYLFTKNNQFSSYENIQSEIFEHLLAIMHEFELKVYQQPTGDDLLLLTKNDLVKPLINN
jgi:miniconductance mechanosensitive channel